MCTLCQPQSHPINPTESTYLEITFVKYGRYWPRIFSLNACGLWKPQGQWLFKHIFPQNPVKSSTSKKALHQKSLSACVMTKYERHPWKFTTARPKFIWGVRWRYKKRKKKKKEVHGPWRSAWQLQLVWQMAIFCRLVSKTHCCRLKQFKSWVNSYTEYLTMHVSILDHFQQLNLAFQRSLKVKCDGGTGLPIGVYDFLLVFNSNIRPNSAPLRYISFQNLSDLDFDFSRSLKSNMIDVFFSSVSSNMGWYNDISLQSFFTYNL